MDDSIDENRRLKLHIKDLEFKIRLKDEILANLMLAVHQVNDALGISTNIKLHEPTIAKGKRVVTISEKQKMVDGYNAGVSITQIAHELNFHEVTVTKVLVDLGLHQPRRPVTEEMKKRWCDDHIAGQSARSIGRMHHVSVNTVAKVLRQAGIFRLACPKKKQLT